MWNESPFGAGGFLETTYDSPGASTGGEKKKRERRAENLVPVTIRQILTGGEELQLGDIVVHMVTFVGLLKNIEMAATKLSYIMEDTTGEIEAIIWLDAPAEKEQAVLNCYYRIIGSLRFSNGKHHVLVFQMEALKDLNDLTRHLLEVVNVSLCAPHLSEIEASNAKMSATMNQPLNTMNQPLNNSLMNMNQPMDDGLDAQAPTDPKQRMVFKVIWDAALNEDGGVDVPYIATKLNSRMKVDQIRTITDFLLQEGFIFSTVDDEHFTVTR